MVKQPKPLTPRSTFGTLPAATPEQMSRYVSTGQQLVKAVR
jgi:hypothetical protein